MNNNLTDKARAVTAEDLIRRYGLDNLKKYETLVTKINATLENQNAIIKQYIQKVAEYTSQVDNTTWFFSGTPTLNSEPFTSFGDPSDHIGELYYDRETGYVYQLSYDSNDDVYSWTLLNDSVLAETLSIANSQADSQDNRRRMFFNQPTVPYDAGDIWVDGNTIKRCRCSRDGDSFSAIEWVLQDEYSEACVLLDVRAVLNSTIYDINENYVTSSSLQTSIDGIYGTVEATYSTKAELQNVDDKFSNYATNDSVTTVTNRVNTIQASTYTKTQIQEIANGSGFDFKPTEDATYQASTEYYLYDSAANTYTLLVEGTDYQVGDAMDDNIYNKYSVTVSALISTEAQFDKDGMHYSKTGAKTSSTINEVGLEVDDDNSNELLFAGYDDDDTSSTYGTSIVRTENITVRNYLVTPGGGRFEEYTDSNSNTGVGFFIGV